MPLAARACDGARRRGRTQSLTTLTFASWTRISRKEAAEFGQVAAFRPGAGGVGKPAADRQLPSTEWQQTGNSASRGGRGVRPKCALRPGSAVTRPALAATSLVMRFPRSLRRLGLPRCCLNDPRPWVMLERGEKIRSFERLCVFRILRSCTVGAPRRLGRSAPDDPDTGSLGAQSPGFADPAPHGTPAMEVLPWARLRRLARFRRVAPPRHPIRAGEAVTSGPREATS